MNTKIIVCARHGESFDDTYNEFGSWNDRNLTPQGILTAYELVHSIKRLGSFDVVYTSPLKRAQVTAQIVGEELNLRVEEDKYLIERNTYGLLAGLNRDLANAEYPELNAAYLEGKYIPGAERYGAFQDRIAMVMKRLIACEEEKIICISHGYVITEIIDTYLGRTRNSMGPGSIVEFRITPKPVTQKPKTKNPSQIEQLKNNFDFQIDYYENITFTEDPEVIKGLKFRKFTSEE